MDNPGLITPKGHTPRGWVTVVPNIAHPDHEGVTGDLCWSDELTAYQILEWNEVAQNYVAYSVAFAWGEAHNPARLVAPPATCEDCGFIGVTVTAGKCGSCTRAAIQADATAIIQKALNPVVIEDVK